MGKEPLWHDGRVVSYVTSAAYGYSIGQSIAYAWLPPELSEEGQAYFSGRYPGLAPQ